jgi:hypothetical protein
MDNVLDIGQQFRVQFVWHLPDGDYIRAVFTAEILNRIDEAENYLVQLKAFLAGRQETDEGEMRPVEAVTREYWAMVDKLTGQIISIAFEAADGRPLHLRLETLTGEHDFFRRFTSQKPGFSPAESRPGQNKKPGF